MSKSTKAWLVTAAVLVVLGAVLFVGAMSAYRWDFAGLSTVTYETNTYEVGGAFDKISIDTDMTEIAFVPADEEACSIVCYEMEKVKHSASVQNGTLVIQSVDTRKWYEYIGVSLGSPRMTVYLPEKAYALLRIETDTGDITVPKDFSFETLEIDGDTADVDCYASVSDTVEIELSTGDIRVDALTAGQLKLTTSTGDIKVNSVTVKNGIDIETNTGEVKLADASCNELIAESDTGGITLKKVIAEGSFFIESNTGDVKFEGSDAAEVFVKTSTGDVTGRLLSEKVFITETSTGRVRVPKTTTGGICRIETSTGDIEITAA